MVGASGIITSFDSSGSSRKYDSAPAKRPTSNISSLSEDTITFSKQPAARSFSIV